MTTSTRDRRAAIGIFVVVLAGYAWFFGGGGWNPNAHVALTRAIVERGTLHIDGYETSGDVSWSGFGAGRHLYINKAPGASILGVLPYAAIHGIERALGVNPDAWLVATINAYLITVLTCGVSGAFLAVVLYAYARRRAGATRLAASALALTVAFATIVFPYATVFFAHVPSALFLLLAFVWLDERPVLAGAAAGIAGATFYFCIPAIAVLAIGAGRRSIRFVAGGMPFAILLLLYHQICFGSPWTTPLEGSTPFVEEGLLLGVMRRPSLEALWGLTFAESHGLFAGSPVLLLSLIGAVRMVRQRVLRRDLAMIGAIVALFLLQVASFNGWHGGHAFGPRYLLSMIPLMAIPLLFVPLRAVAALAIASAAMQFVATAVNPMPPNIARPMRDFLVPAFATGRVAPELAAKIGVPHGAIGNVGVNPQSVDEYCAGCRYAPDSPESRWASFNLGELVTGPSRRVSVLPVALWLVAGTAWLLATARADPPSGAPQAGD